MVRLGFVRSFRLLWSSFLGSSLPKRHFSATTDYSMEEVQQQYGLRRLFSIVSLYGAFLSSGKNGMLRAKLKQTRYVIREGGRSLCAMANFSARGAVEKISKLS